MDNAKKRQIKKYASWISMVLVVALLTAMPLLARTEPAEDGPTASILSGTVDYGSMEDAEQAQKEVTLQIPGVEYETQVVEGKLKYSFRIADVFKQEAFVEEAGQFSYDILYSLLLNEKFRSLDDFRKSTVIRNAYSYAKERSRKNLYSDYEMGSNVRKKLYSENATPAEVGKALLEDALD